MSRLNSKTSSLTQGNVNTHIFTEFSDMAKEGTQKEMLQAIKDINIDVGQIVVGDITVDSSDTITHTKLDTLNTTITGKTLSKTTSSIDISGQSVVVNTIAGYATSALQTDGNDILGVLSGLTGALNDNVIKIVDREGDIEANIYYTQGAPVWADSVPTPTVNVLEPNGWLYTNTSANNAMNLFYFNGLNEIRRLSEVTGQYAVVSNLSTKVNTYMIFGIYTKSATSFFTTRVTHSPNGDIDMIAGGKYLLYWGDVPDNLFPNLPRIEFTDVVTTGPANPLEEVLAVTLNTDSGAPAGDINISVDTLGVLFNGQSRSYNLLGSPTEYQTLVNIKTNSDKLKYIGEDLKVVFSNSGIAVNNFPATQLISGSVSVSNLPATQPVSGSVSISNLPATQPVSGTVAVSTLPAIGITNTSFEVSNFPATQPISGSVSVSNLPATQPVSGSVSISNLPATQPVSGTVAVSTLPAIGITNTAFGVNNFPATQAVSGSVNVGNFPVTQPVSGSVSISNLPATQPVSGTVAVSTLPAIGITNTSFEVSNFPATQPVSGSVSVSNLPATQPVSGTVAVSTLPAIGITNTSFEVSNFPATQPVSGSVNVGNFPATQPVSGSVSISNLPATQPVSGTVGVSSLPAIGITNTAFGVNNFPVTQAVSGLVSVENSTNPFNVNITGGTITGADGKAYLYNGAGTTAITASGVGAKNGIDTNIINASIDTHLYSNHNGTWVDVESAANGHLLVNASTQDGDGVGITSTLIGGNKQSLDVNVANTTAIPVSGTFYQATQPVSGSVNIGSGGTTAGISILATDIQSSERGLITSSCLFARAPAFGGVSTSLTCITNGSRAYLETRDEDAVAKLTSIETDIETTNSRLTTTNSTLSTINGKLLTTTNDNSVVGLNVYQIYPKTIRYRLAGSSTAVQTYQFLGPEANAVYDGRNFTIGLNQLKNFNIYISPTNPTPTITKSVDVDYINSVGDRVVETISITNVDTDRLFGVVNINNLSWTSAPTNGNNSGTVIARNVAFRNQLSPYVSGAGVITVPNGYIGVISNLYFYAGAGDSVMMYVRDKYNNLKTARYIEGINPTPGKTVNFGDINEPLIAGDSVYFMNVNPASGGRFINAIVSMTAI